MSKKERPEMTRKEALAVLHKIYNAVGWHLLSDGVSEEEKALNKQAFAAFLTLDVALHGEQAKYYSDGLCRLCYLRMGMEGILVHAKGQSFREPCCTTCFEQLKTENKIESIAVWDGDDWAEKGAPLCNY